jgi:heme-degrading monooxygenase HmoA
MVTEIVRATIKPGQEEAYRKAFAEAAPILQAAKGYVDHSLQQCIEDPTKFVLMVHWQTYADHVDGFRGSEPWDRFRAATAPYQAERSEVLHYQVPGG